MIRAVYEADLSEWSYLACRLWSSKQESLEKDFLQGKFPYEFLYWKENKALAFMSLSLRNDYVEGAKASPVAYLEGIFVLKDYQGLGIARELLEFAKTWAKEQGVTELASDCNLDNLPSHDFHVRLGFKEVSRNIHFILEVDEK